MKLYDRNMGAATGLSMVPKIMYEHIFLGAFSKMHVDLAAQVVCVILPSSLPPLVSLPEVMEIKSEDTRRGG